MQEIVMVSHVQFPVPCKRMNCVSSTMFRSVVPNSSPLLFKYSLHLATASSYLQLVTTLTSLLVSSIVALFTFLTVGLGNQLYLTSFSWNSCMIYNTNRQGPEPGPLFAILIQMQDEYPIDVIFTNKIDHIHTYIKCQR